MPSSAVASPKAPPKGRDCRPTSAFSFGAGGPPLCKLRGRRGPEAGSVPRSLAPLEPRAVLKSGLSLCVEIRLCILDALDYGNQAAGDLEKLRVLPANCRSDRE